MKAHAQRSIGRLVGIMVIIVVAGILVARSYYGNLNQSVDPRIQPARELYERYDKAAVSGDYYRIFKLLDTISAIYQKIPHYRESFELGVLHNNRAAAFLTMALYPDSIPASRNPFYELSPDSLASLAKQQVKTAIAIYEGWNKRFQGKEGAKIRLEIQKEFLTGLVQSTSEMNDKYLNTRVKEIENSLVENDRRLSVCYTNLGLVYRLQEEYPEAVAQYEKALELWDRNLDAENNLNKLLGRPPRKRNIIQKLFPPSKELSTKK